MFRAIPYITLIKIAYIKAPETYNFRVPSSKGVDVVNVIMLLRSAGDSIEILGEVFEIPWLAS